ncbi:O-methyltransferase [Mycena indigotica]|uniref:O-methyltransferase n=1 Tax=Mycena indigotica TaxID=2126181 RepID=A0A8H6W3I3_9AGAR|nr:O-methyltransferase [Mycena indigotica]KAF7303632.1 O-methyltransferase [Mycena indigotica]
MTFSVLRALHTIIGDALSDIEHIYANLSGPYASPPPSPTSPVPSSNLVDFPSLDASFDPLSQAEQLTTHPTVAAAINRIVSAAGQLSATVNPPFLTICDAAMGYHLPSCLRLLEATHIPEILRDGPLHVRELANKTGVEQGKLAHILRLLATHHILREVEPDVFATNRISSLIDSGRPAATLRANPKRKYDEDGGAVAAFVGLCTDELHKASAYLTEAVFPDVDKIFPEVERSLFARAPPSNPSSTSTLPAHSDPTRAPFNHAFGCAGVGYFAWLEGEGCVSEVEVAKDHPKKNGHRRLRSIGGSTTSTSSSGSIPLPLPLKPSSSPQPAPPPQIASNPNQFRLERFGKAMAGTGSWEAPGAVLAGFDWASLPPGSTIVDVGGGIGSTTMILASDYAGTDGDGLRFVVQDRQVVVEMGEKAWRAKCPEFLDSGSVRFQVHDFFTPQPILNAAVYFLRVVLHDWPDAFAHKILLRLREAAGNETRLVIADWVLPMACVDDFGVGEESAGQVEGAEKMLAPAPLLANLGKASANVYWMDLTMQVTFNGQERTLREIVGLAASAGWKVVRVTKAPGSLFGHIVAIPVAVPISASRRARSGSGSAFFEAGEAANSRNAKNGADDGDGMEIVERASSRCGTPTFGSRVNLPSVAEAKRVRGQNALQLRKPFGYGAGAPTATATFLRQPAPIRKKTKPSPLASSSNSTVAYSPMPSPAPGSASSLRSMTVTSPRPTQPGSPVITRSSQGLHSPIARRSRTPFRSQSQIQISPRESPVPVASPRPTLSRRSSHAQLSPTGPAKQQGLRHMPSSPVLKQSSDSSRKLQQQPSPPSPIPSRIPALPRRASIAQLQPPPSSPPQPPVPAVPSKLLSPLRSVRRMGSLLLPGRASGGTLDFARYEESDDEGLHRPDLLPAGSVLAEAAQIERGQGFSRDSARSPDY